MKHSFLLLLLLFSLNATSQHTFSIVAVDSVTNEIGSAGATCLPQEDGALYVSDIILNVGAINTQAWWTRVNQNAARQRMAEGLSPQEIVDWLIANDNPSQGGNILDRQYGIVDLNNGSPRSAAYTGANNFDVKGQRIGSNYAIQGNILISEDVLDDMESAFMNTDGSLASKLMATLQAAKRPGADARCLNMGISSASAYLRVAKPTDSNSSYGSLWLDINTWLDSGEFTGDPIDEVQRKFDLFNQTVTTEEIDNSGVFVFPNPTSNSVTIDAENESLSKIELYDMLGNLIKIEHFLNENPTYNLNLNDLATGQYMLLLHFKNDLTKKRVTIHKSE